MDDTRQTIIDRLADGESLSAICRDDEMPCWRTVHNWMDDGSDFDAQVTRAREIGYQIRAERAVEDAKKAEDAALARLAFDADRWYLGKLSNAFSDNKEQKHKHAVDLSDEAKAWLGL
jgi:hypothetical protein